MNPEQRQFFRSAFLNEPPTAVLIHGRNRVECCLVDRSLGGFAVVAASELKNATNALARLKLLGMEYIVRITHQDSLGDCVLVGMERIEELLPSNLAAPDSSVFRHLTVAAWGLAMIIVGAAFYCLPHWFPTSGSLSDLR